MDTNEINEPRGESLPSTDYPASLGHSFTYYRSIQQYVHGVIMHFLPARFVSQDVHIFTRLPISAGGHRLTRSSTGTSKNTIVSTLHPPSRLPMHWLATTSMKAVRSQLNNERVNMWRWVEDTYFVFRAFGVVLCQPPYCLLLNGRCDVCICLVVCDQRACISLEDGESARTLDGLGADGHYTRQNACPHT